MNSAIDDFEQRVAEVRKFIRLLARMEQADSPVEFAVSGKRVALSIDDDWLRVGKAAVFLMMYNVVEASIRNGFTNIYDAIKNERCTHAVVSEAIRRVWIEQRHRRITYEDAAPKNHLETARAVVEEIVRGVVVELNSARLPGAGSFDADRIRFICSEHGVEIINTPRAKGGASLVEVKRRRNDLAHGNITFAECGREVAVRDLVRIAREARIFLRGVRQSLSTFVASKKYTLCGSEIPPTRSPRSNVSFDGEIPDGDGKTRPRGVQE